VKQQVTLTTIDAAMYGPREAVQCDDLKRAATLLAKVRITFTKCAGEPNQRAE
jgi:hypothetical protein